jgi:hypothetical protein
LVQHLLRRFELCESRLSHAARAPVLPTVRTAPAGLWRTRRAAPERATSTGGTTASRSVRASVCSRQTPGCPAGVALRLASERRLLVGSSRIIGVRIPRFYPRVAAHETSAIL